MVYGEVVPFGNCPLGQQKGSAKRQLFHATPGQKPSRMSFLMTCFTRQFVEPALDCGMLRGRHLSK
jgi:hypothetical protein